MAGRAGSSANDANGARARGSGPGRPGPDRPGYNPVTGRPSVQSQLTESTFENYLDGFVEIQPEDLLALRGGRVRYVIETLDARGTRVRSRAYRLGGYLTSVDPALRYFRLLNPYGRRAWSVQLRTPGQRVRLYYCAPATSDEVASLRKLLAMMENGEIRITRAPGNARE